MAHEVSLSYGGTSLLLSQSETLIAILPTAGARSRVESEIQREGHNTSGDIGEFIIIDISSVSSQTSLEEYIEAAVANPDNGRVSKVFYSSDDGVPFVPNGKLYVEFQPDASPDRCQAALRSNGLSILEARGANSLIATCGKNAGVAVEIAAALQADAIVKTAEPDLITEGLVTSFAPTDELLTLQWHLKNEGAHHGTSIGFKRGADARVVEAWQAAASLGSAQVVIAIIDDGFDLAHPDLSDVNRVRMPHDFARGSNQPLPDNTAKNWHGTACAGVALGRSNRKGIVGAAPDCSFMPIRWGASLSDDNVEAWFAYVTDNSADVVSCSWSARARNYPLSTRKHQAIAACVKKGRKGLGCVVCFAADNYGRDINDPAAGSVNGFANHPDVITVSACTSMDERSDYSSYGDNVWITAPSSGAGGWGITTADVTGSYEQGGQSIPAGYAAGDFTSDFGGTSSACPLVAGICALILSTKPDLSATQVKELLRSTARRVGAEVDYDQSGHSRHFGWGCIDAASAIRATQELV